MQSLSGSVRVVTRYNLLTTVLNLVTCEESGDGSESQNADHQPFAPATRAHSAPDVKQGMCQAVQTLSLHLFTLGKINSPSLHSPIARSTFEWF